MKMSPRQAKAAYKSAAHYSSDDAVLEMLLASTNALEQIALGEVLAERGHGDLVLEFHKEDCARKVTAIGAVFAHL